MTRGAFGRFQSGARTLAASEDLDELPEERLDRTRASFLSWLFKPEPLPLDPADSTAGRPSVLSWLLATERLPVDDPGAEPFPRPGAGDRSARR